MTIGTTARKDANTNASTASAPSAPSTASSRSPGPSAVLAAVLGQGVEAGQVHRLRRPTVAPLSAALAAFSAFGFSPNAESGSGCG